MMNSRRMAVAVIGMVIALAACASAPIDEKPREVPILMSWSGSYPVAELTLLPRDQRNTRNGFFDTRRSFARVWSAYMPQKALPEVDFKENLVIFSRNLKFFNQTSIVNASVNNGVLEIVAIATMSAQPIRDRVAMAMAVVPRKGLKAIRINRDKTLRID